LDVDAWGFEAVEAILTLLCMGFLSLHLGVEVMGHLGPVLGICWATAMAFCGRDESRHFAKKGLDFSGSGASGAALICNY
jgi:hypothetical protein